LTPVVPQPHAGVLARLSIGQKMLLATFGLLLFVTGALISATYFQARRTAEVVASERLRGISRQMGDMLRTSSLQLGTQSRAMSRKPALRAFIESPSPATRSAATAALEYTGPATNQVLRVELRNARDSILLVSTAGAAAGGSVGEFGKVPEIGEDDSITVGLLRQVRDTVLYPVAARVPGTTAYVVHWRQMATSRRAREQLSRLIGSDATVLIGDADGSFWTDLEGAASVPRAPSGRIAGDTSGQVFRAGDMLVSAVPIAGTPWIVRVQAPREAAMAPVGDFIVRLALIAALCLAVGLLLAWLLSRRITDPLRRLTVASDALAAGQHPLAIAAHGTDEIGRLGRSFDTMARQIDEARALLEQRVTERTRELNEALSALHQAQDTLVRKEKLAMLGQLASSVGHELRNPLGVMTNAVYYLEAVQRDAPETVKDYLGILRQQITLSERIVSDLLDFARIRAPQRERVNVASLVRTQLERAGTQSGVRLDQNVPTDLPTVHVDPVQMGQVVLNMLSNAMQAMGDKGGVLGIRARLDGDNRLLLEVSDTGSGVADEIREKIFEPLFTTKARGIGLGLAVSRSLARANDADLTLARAKDPTTFVLTLPLDAKGA
jgi:signal transduction histidine kinase